MPAIVDSNPPGSRCVEEPSRSAARNSRGVTAAPRSRERAAASALAIPIEDTHQARGFSMEESLGGRGLNSRLSILLNIDRALMRERPEPKDAVIAAHAALIDAAERQLVLQVMREESVDRHTA